MGTRLFPGFSSSSIKLREVPSFFFEADVSLMNRNLDLPLSTLPQQNPTFKTYSCFFFPSAS